MNKEVATIGGGVIGGMVSNGLSSVLPQSDSPIMNFALALASGFAFVKVQGTDTKSQVLKGACLGSAVVQSLIGVRKVSEKNNVNEKITGTGKMSQFGRGALGLACPHDEGLNAAFVGADGLTYELDEQGLNGTFADENGNIYNQLPNGQLIDQNGNIVQVAGLNGYEEEYLDTENGLSGANYIYGEEEQGLLGADEELASMYE